jgi:hypothetical protein
VGGEGRGEEGRGGGGEEGVREREEGACDCFFVYVGKQIVGYVRSGRNWEVIGTRSPQDAQVSYTENPECWFHSSCGVGFLPRWQDGDCEA